MTADNIFNARNVFNERIDKLKYYAFKINYIKVYIKHTNYNAKHKQLIINILDVIYLFIKNLIHRQCCIYNDIIVDVEIFKQNVFSEIFNKKLNIHINENNVNVDIEIISTLNNFLNEISNDRFIFDKIDEVNSIKYYTNKIIQII